MSTTLNSAYKTVALVLLTVLISVVGAWAAHTNMRIDRQDERISAIEKAIAANEQAHHFILASQQDILSEIRALRKVR